jgi:hypothetical protein
LGPDPPIRIPIRDITDPATGRAVLVKFVPAEIVIVVFIPMLFPVVPIKIIGMHRINCCAAKYEQARADKKAFEA